MVGVFVRCSIGGTVTRCISVLICCGQLLMFGKVVWIERLHCIQYLKLGSRALLYDLMEDIGM